MLMQIQRRAVDRFWSNFINLRRYQCHHFGCKWEGNLLKSPDSAIEAKSVSPMRVASKWSLLALIATILVIWWLV